MVKSFFLKRNNMATINRFEDLQIWQMAREYCKLIYPLTCVGAFARDFKLKDQINGASGSIMDNIAEGFERNGKLEMIQFLSIAKGSCGESRSQLYRALDRAYITEEQMNHLCQLSENISNKIGSFITYLNNTEHKGLKFKDRK